MTADSPLDARKLDELRDLAGPDDPDFYARLLRTYLSDAQAKFERMGEALAARDAEALRDEAHALRGSSGNLGAHRLWELCSVLEAAADAGTIDDDAVEAVTAEYERVRQALDEELA